MSFNVVTALWIAKIFILYTLMVVVLPSLVMRRLLRGRSWTQKFVFSVVAGNFFYIMLVLLWGLIHVTNRYVLIASTLVIPAVMLIRRRNELWERHLKKVWINVRRFARRENSFRYSMRLIFRWGKGKIRKAFREAGGFLRKNLPELILFIGCSAFVIWYFSMTDHFGPRESDISVHMYWINGIDEGILFREGVYPFGMHALLYYFHAVFDIPTVRIILVFGTVQTFYIFTMLLAFLKEICRFRYTPYLAYFAFAVGDYLVGGADYGGAYSRYYSALPQEFGMMFILPCAIALIRFFRAVRDETAEYERMKREKLLYTKIGVKRRVRESTVQLWVLIISFGLTLSAHFYNTFIAAFLVLSAAAAYIRFVIRPKILRRLICAAVIAVMIPLFPMAMAYAGGTPLQASLYWGMEVMGIEGEEGTEETEATDETQVTEEPDADIDELESQSAENEAAEEKGETVQAISLKESIIQYINTVKEVTADTLNYHIFKSDSYMLVWAWCLLALLIEIPIMWILREWEYSRYIVMTLVYTGLLVLLCVSGDLGLPELMDQERSPIFCCYTVLAGFSLAIDGLLVILNRIIKVRSLWQAVSFALAALFVFYSAADGTIRPKITETSSYERDGAALCVYDIMKNYPDQKWTIVSCNEERNMVSPVSWHYEVIDFLESMENYREGDEMYFPTQYVFFFIEKNSLDYGYGEFTDEDAHVSERWASESLPAKNALLQYTGTNRIIVNSRMYYWAKEYQKRFPNELKVYYEDDDFICYYIEQNEYYLNNFAIDYGYNSGGEADD